jgi:ERF superfamily protein
MTDQNALAAALAQLQTQLPKIRKSETAQVRSEKGSYSYSYADLAGISEQLLPIMGKLGLSFTSRPTLSGDRFVLAYRLWHTSGECLDGEYPLPAGGTPQQVGSAITYGRRYCLCAVTGIAPEDDDGAAATHAQTAPTQAARKPAAKASAYSREGNRPAGQDLTIGPKQLAALHIKLKAYGIGGEENRDAALAYMAETIGHDLDTSKALTEAEFRRVMNRLDAEMQPRPEDTQQTPPEPGGEDDPWTE